jgi:hypothetical protein
MPTGTPRIGNSDTYGPRQGPEVLGSIPNTSRITDPAPQEHTSRWQREDGTIMELTEPAPPWETNDDKFSASDARRFVECPPNWRLHWINPRLLDSEGWRDWQPVSATDPRVNVRVKTMVTPENYIRRGGPSGDILAWMWQGWYESVKQKMREKTAAQTQSAVEKQASLKEEFARGKFGPYLRVDQTTHPTHTQGEGRTMRDS